MNLSIDLEDLFIISKYTELCQEKQINNKWTLKESSFFANHSKVS
jgi:hypothetical protein